MKTHLSAAAAVAVVLLAVFTVWIDRRAKSLETVTLTGVRTPALTGKAAPDFSLPALDGHNVSLADYRGKNLLVTFWASWCGPCRSEIPALNRLYAAAHKPDSNFELLAISVDEDPAAASAFASSMNVPYPVLLDRGMKAVDAFQVESIPTLFLVGADGKVEYAKAGYAPGEEMIVAQRLGLRDFAMPFQGGFRVRHGN